MATPANRRPLADAIAERETARRNLEDARAAFEKTQAHVWTEAAELDRLRAQLDQPDDTDAIIRAARAGDLAVLEKPKAELRSQVERLEQSVANWRRARDAAQGQIEPREAALARAEEKVSRHAEAALLALLDASELLAEAEETQRRLVDLRLRLAWLRTLPGKHSRQIDAFLSTPFLQDELSGAWERHAVTEPLRAALQDLKQNAGAKLVIELSGGGSVLR